LSLAANPASAGGITKAQMGRHKSYSREYKVVLENAAGGILAAQALPYLTALL